jgi:hypothetical protein
MCVILYNCIHNILVYNAPTLTLLVLIMYAHACIIVLYHTNIKTKMLLFPAKVVGICKYKMCMNISMYFPTLPQLYTICVLNITYSSRDVH